MMKFYDHLFNADQLEEMKNEILNLRRENKHIDEVDLFSECALGFGVVPSVDKHGEYLTDIIQKDFGREYIYSHSYARMYLKGGVLRPHIDKRDLDITLTVNIYSTVDKIWPIYASDTIYTGDRFSDIDANTLPNHHKFNIGPGQGAAILGTTHPHWRDTLECGEDDYYIQVFYHWTRMQNIPLHVFTAFKS